jgi:hypothetical protein
MSYPLALEGLSCDSSIFAKVTHELPTIRTVVALRRKGYQRASTSRTVVVCVARMTNELPTSMTVAALRCKGD